MIKYSVKITPYYANSWQSCTLCSRSLDESWASVRNLNTEEFFNVCTPCLNTMNVAIKGLKREVKPNG